jgi:microcin C transport system ATP-binding protein
MPFSGTSAGQGQAWGRDGGGQGPAPHVQVVFQDPFSSLSPRMTVEEIVGEGLLVHEPGLAPAERRSGCCRRWPMWA